MDKTEILQKEIGDLTTQEQDLLKEISETGNKIAENEKQKREVSSLQNSINDKQSRIERLKPTQIKLKARLTELEEFLKDKDITKLQEEYDNKIKEEDILLKEVQEIEKEMVQKETKERNIATLNNKISARKQRNEQLMATRDKLLRKLTGQ